MNDRIVDLLFWTHWGATLYMVGLIWFIQVVHYPLLAYVGSARSQPTRNAIQLDYLGRRASDAHRRNHRLWSNMVRPARSHEWGWVVHQLDAVGSLVAIDCRNPNALP